MKRALIVASVASMIQQFNMNNIHLLQELGYKVDVATNFLDPGTMDKEHSDSLKSYLKSQNVDCFQIDFSRGIGNLKANVKSFKQIKSLVSYNYALVHCHSPIGGVLTRLAFKNSESKIIYTAHGFHFYKGGPLRNWLIFYPIEKFLSRYTDILLTINNEDTEIAQSFHTKKVIQIHGVGIKWNKFRKSYSEKSLLEIKQALKLENDRPVLISIGEISDRKNHIMGIEFLRESKEKFYYIICGKGNLESELKRKVSEYNLFEQVKFVGYSENIVDYLAISDLSLFLSKREGLGLAGLEALASGTPLISSYIGGIKDYTEDGITGFTIKDPTDLCEIKLAIEKWYGLSDEERIDMIKNSIIISENYDEKKVNELMKSVYSNCILNN